MKAVFPSKSALISLPELASLIMNQILTIGSQHPLPSHKQTDAATPAPLFHIQSGSHHQLSEVRMSCRDNDARNPGKVTRTLQEKR